MRRANPLPAKQENVGKENLEKAETGFSMLPFIYRELWKVIQGYLGSHG